MHTSADIHLAVQDLAHRSVGPTVSARAARGSVVDWTLPGNDAPRLVEVMAGLRRPMRGRVLLDDLDLSEFDLEQLAAWRLGCVAVLDAPPRPAADAFRFVTEPLRRRGFSRSRSAALARTAIRAWSRWLEQPTRRGNALVLARATAQQPDLVFAPTSWRRDARVLLRTLRDLGASGPTLVRWHGRG